MTKLTSKQVLVIGEKTPHTKALAELLEAHGVGIQYTACDSFDPKVIEESQIDLILLNYLSAEKSCSEILSLIKNTAPKQTVPVFVLIKDSAELIQEVLSLGAADYITSDEDPSLILDKVESVFGQSEMFSSGTTIDITPPPTALTTTGVRVYVVEDDPLLRNLLAIRLDKSKFPYEFSDNGENVVPAMQQFKPDVIILDLMLPGKSGFEILSDIKTEKELSNIPVIVFSNRDGQDDRQQAEELGAKKFYVKAMTDLSELVETIESLAK